MAAADGASRRRNNYVSATLFLYPKTRISWINGIAYNMQDMITEQHDISKHFGNQRIHFCHNPSDMKHNDDIMGYIYDLKQAGQQKFLNHITEEVNALIQHLKDCVTAVGPNGSVIHIAHSQGALITYLAAIQYQQQQQMKQKQQQQKPGNTNTTTEASPYLTYDEMSQIEIVSFGGAAAIRKTEMTPFKRCMNYYSVNDPLLYIVPEAAAALRSGFSISHANNEFCFLAPRSGDPIMDHKLTGPTYSQALQWEGDRYQLLYIHPLERYLRYIVIFLQSILQFLSNRIHAIVYKGMIHPMVVFSLYLWNRIQTVSNNIRTFSIFLILLIRECMKRMIHTILSHGRKEEKYVPVVA